MARSMAPIEYRSSSRCRIGAADSLVDRQIIRSFYALLALTLMAKNLYPIAWHWIKLETTDTWSVVLRKLKNSGIKERALSRCVYSIRISARFAIKYPGGVSPTLYVGEGRLRQRVDSHRKWLAEFEKVFGPLKLELAVATPRVQNNTLAYKETEAALI